MGASLVYLLGDTETLQQQAQAPQPVSLHQLCARKTTPSMSPSPSSSELEQASVEVGLQGMLNAICSAVSSQGLGLRPGHMGNRRRSSSMSARLAAIPDISEMDDGHNGRLTGADIQQQLGAGRAGQLLQQLALLRGSGTEQPSNLRQLSNAAGVAGAGATAAAMLHQYTSTAQASGASCGSTSSEDLAQSSESDEDDSSMSGPTGATSESACSSQIAAGDGSVISCKLGKPQPPVVMDQLEAVLASSYEWQFDAFALNTASQGHPLSTLGYYLFHKQGLIEHFNLKPTSLARFLRR